MKKYIPTPVFYTLITFLFLLNSTEGKAVDYDFQFQIKDLVTTEKCVLGYYSGNFTYAIDSSKVAKNGLVKFTGNRDLLDGLYFLMVPKLGMIDFIVYKDYQFQIKTEAANLKKYLSVKGSKENEAYFA